MIRGYNFDATIGADNRLIAADRLVSVLVALAPEDGRSMCAGCVWEHVLKPLTTDVIGWSRGGPPVAATGMERWLRTSAAYDLVTDEWLAQLEQADPHRGHGLPDGTAMDVSEVLFRTDHDGSEHGHGGH